MIKNINYISIAESGKAEEVLSSSPGQESNHRRKGEKGALHLRGTQKNKVKFSQSAF